MTSFSDSELLAFPASAPAWRGPHWIQIISGAPFWPLDPHPDDVKVEDIAWSLARIPRFTGHVLGDPNDPDAVYTVGAHSLWMSEAVARYDRSAALCALVDDFEEAYINDYSAPFVAGHSELQGILKSIKQRLKACIAVAFDLPWPFPEIVKEVDRRILYNERDSVISPSLHPWEVEYEPIPNLTVRGWRPSETYTRLLERFRELDTDPSIPRYHHPRY